MTGDAVATYFKEMLKARATGGAQDERSYYTPLCNLLNAIGARMKPKVSAQMELKNQGAGMPDGGLYTADQIRKSTTAKGGLLTQKPSRGVIECKKLVDETSEILAGQQVEKYWNSYRQVLVTNFREFVLVTEDKAGKPLTHECCTLASSEAEFWQLCLTPDKSASNLGAAFSDYLERVLTYRASIRKPEDLAGQLAVYAQIALRRIAQHDLARLKKIRGTMQEALGVSFEG